MDTHLTEQDRVSTPMQLTYAQDQLVQAVVRDAPSRWARIVVDVEIEETADDHAMDTVSFAIVAAPDSVLSDPELKLSIETRRAVVDLFVATRAMPNALQIGGFLLTVEQDGRYGFEWSHEAPKRLHGVWDAAKEARLDNYLDLHRHEFGGSR